jgi:SAM-dependent methyltransferase
VSGDLEGWPFWAPSDDDVRERALRLAEVGRGTRFVELGCGDGRVLVAAAQRGASVLGIESDPDMADVARKRLADAGIDGEIVEGDIFELDLSGDVLFAYLSPATLQRLVPLLPRRGTLVTVDFAVPGLVADAEEDRLNLYRLPGKRARRRRRTGWPSAGSLSNPIPDHETLTCLQIVAPGGPLNMTVTGSLKRAAAVRLGADEAAEGQVVAEDDGTLVTGEIRIDGLPPHPVFALYAGDSGELWELSDEGVENLRRRFRSRNAPLTTIDEVLEAAEA